MFKQNAGSKKLVSITVLGVLVGALCIYVLSNQVTKERLAALENHTRDAVTEQQALLVAIAETTARNGADAVTEEIIRDCQLSDRNRFDSLLSQLDSGLSSSELAALERLFDRCGSFYAERKAVMVSRLMREIEVYEYFVHQLGLISDTDVTEKYNIGQWQKLAQEEQKQSQLYAELVRLQGQIIATLVSGGAQADTDLDTVLLEVREVQETLIVINKQVGNIRSELVGL